MYTKDLIIPHQDVICVLLLCSREEAEPGAGPDRWAGEGEVLLLLLAGPPLHRQREGDLGADDRGAGRGEGGAGQPWTTIIVEIRHLQNL